MKAVLRAEAAYLRLVQKYMSPGASCPLIEASLEGRRGSSRREFIWQQEEEEGFQPCETPGECLGAEGQR